MTRSVAMVNSNGPVGILIKANTKMMKEMAMVKWHGQMVVNT